MSPDELSDAEWDEAWTRELERRCAELKSGEATPIPADEVMRYLRQKFGASGGREPPGPGSVGDVDANTEDL